MHIDKIDHDDLDKQKRFSSDLESQNPLFDLKKVDILIEGLWGINLYNFLKC